MKKIISYIEKNIEPEVNLPKYADEMTLLYYRNSCVRMMMNYYTFKEIINESTGDNKVLDELSTRLEDIIKTALISAEQSSDCFDMLSELRNKNISIVNALTAYTDIFSLYEHILNRVEYKFDENSAEKAEEYKGITDEDITRSVMQYILSEKDNMVINQKIAMVVRELPVRMTKSRFYEYITEGLKVYKGHEKKSLDDFIFMIKSSAAIDLPDDLYDYFTELNDIFEMFKNTSFSNITKEQYDNLKNALTYGVDFLENTVSTHMMLQENINDLFVILLSNQYILTVPDELENLKDVIKLVDELSSDEDLDEIDSKVTDIFASIEGIQEDIGEKTARYEYVLDMINSDMKDITESLMLSVRYNLLTKIRDLSSGSIFVEFDKEYDLSEADMSYINKKTELLVDDFNKVFKDNEKLINRSRMSIALSILPVFFNNISEMQDYIYEALSQCGDGAEKLACKELLLSIVNEY